MAIAAPAVIFRFGVWACSTRRYADKTESRENRKHLGAWGGKLQMTGGDVKERAMHETEGPLAFPDCYPFLPLVGAERVQYST